MFSPTTFESAACPDSFSVLSTGTIFASVAWICFLTASPAVLYFVPSAPTRMSCSSASPVVDPLGSWVKVSIRDAFALDSVATSLTASTTLFADVISDSTVLLLSPEETKFHKFPKLNFFVFPFDSLKIEMSLSSSSDFSE